MSPDRLLAHFERISEAPDAVPRLRRFILDLAVRGKLVEQDPGDEPASELLKRIQAEKARLVKEGKIRKQPQLPAIDSANTPFIVPKHWAWLQLDGIGVLSGGMTPSKNRSEFWEGSINWFSPKDIKADELVNSELKITAIGMAETGLQLYPPGCLFMVARSGILKRTFPVSINRVEATANQDLKVLAPFMDGLERYLQIMFRGMTGFILSALVKTGTTVQSLKYEEFESQPFPLPPLAEQHRIVAKVDELMALCDRLEAAQAERESRRDRVVAASLNRLNNGADAESFREHARFHLRHLPCLTARPEHIQQLRQTILNLAVRGKLIPQDPNDEPAPAFGIGLKSDREDRLDLQLPRGWSWARVEDVAEARLGKMLDKAKNSGQPYRYLRNTNVHWFNVRMDELKYLQIEEAETKKYLLRNGDVLICEGGHGIGRTAVWRAKETDIAFQKALHRVRPGPALSSDFFAYCVFVYSFLGVLQTYFTGVGIPHFTGKALSILVFPLPPLAEQYRIVARVDVLMALCDRLEAKLITVETERRHLLDASLNGAMASENVLGEAIV